MKGAYAMSQHLWLLPVTGALMLLAGQTMAAERIARITVEAGKYERIDAPISAPLEDLGRDMKPPRMEETTAGGAAPVVCQIDPGPPRRLCWILSGKTPAGATRTFVVWPVEAPPATVAPVEVRVGKDTLDVSCGDTKVLKYHAGVVAPPEGAKAALARSGYIHPAWTPSGLVVTEDFPSDHLHQRGIFMAWTKTEFEGRHPDFWNIGSGSATVRFKSRGPTASGPIYGGFQVNQEYVDLEAPGGGKVVLNEVLDVRIWRVGGPDKGYGLWDFTSTQRCASASPLKLPKYHYGGLGYRGAPEWMANCRMLTSEGKTRADGNETAARWCDVSGLSGGKAAGVLILGHPRNFRHPEPLRLNPQQPQICFAPSQAGEWSIEPGKDYVWRYRFCVHDGEMSREQADRLWADFGEPPAVRVEK
jgi:hypothetical protein